MRKCNTKFLLICSVEETNSSTSWQNFILGSNTPLNCENQIMMLQCMKLNAMQRVLLLTSMSSQKTVSTDIIKWNYELSGIHSIY